MSISTRIEPETSGTAAPSRSKWTAFVALVLLTALGWVYLGLMIAGHMDPMAGHGLSMPGHQGGFAAFGPGMGWLDRLMPPAGLDPSLRALVDALCRPSFGHAPLAETATEASVAILMWVAMVLAMMLPTAAPMIMSAAGVADAAARRHESAASPLAVMAGYVAVWSAFAVLAAAAQMALTRLALLDAGMATASPLFAGTVFIAAGAYQFSSVKDRCAANCQRPLPFFAAERGRSGGFRLGLRQGRYCVGCCWAMMLLMFAVGTMNLIWMAGLGLVMATEKVAGTPLLSRLLGLVMFAIGTITIAVAVMARWPV
jgi:predicted metal-binding membrane protein